MIVLIPVEHYDLLREILKQEKENYKYICLSGCYKKCNSGEEKMSEIRDQLGNQIAFQKLYFDYVANDTFWIELIFFMLKGQIPDDKVKLINQLHPKCLVFEESTEALLFIQNLDNIH